MDVRFFSPSLSFSFFFLNDHHPRAHSNSECVGTDFYECVLSLGISETFLHPVRIILFTLGLQYSLLYWPKFQPFHQKSPAPEKKVSRRTKHTCQSENSWEQLWVCLEVAASNIPCFSCCPDSVRVWREPTFCLWGEEKKVSQETMEKLEV